MSDWGDTSPDGEPIDAFTLWLDFPEGEIALSLDLTGFNAAMRGLQDSLARRQRPETPKEPRRPLVRAAGAVGSCWAECRSGRHNVSRAPTCS